MTFPDGEEKGKISQKTTCVVKEYCLYLCSKVPGGGDVKMWMIAISVMTSTVVTVAITVKVKKDILKYIREVCDLNIEQTNKIKEITLNSIEALVNQSRRG